MAIPPALRPLKLPVIGSPMFIASSPELVVAQCHAGIVGTMPSLNVRDGADLEPTLAAIAERVGAREGSAPFGVNLISHRSNQRLEHDLAACVRQRVPLIITSLGPSAAITDEVHAYGGLVFHDVIQTRHARKAVEAGVDGIIAVAAGAGGHGGTLSPFALCAEIRSFFDGTLVLAGSLSSGGDIAATRALGADMAYVGTRFIATLEANAADKYKAMIIASGTSDIVYTPFFSGVHGNYMASSIAAAGLDPHRLATREKGSLAIGTDGTKAKAWKDVWSAGHGVAAVADVPSVAELIERWRDEYADAHARVARDLAHYE